MSVTYTGFSSFFETGKYTPDFIEDVNAMILRDFKRWSLYETEDEFTSFCWAKIVKAMKIYSSENSLSAYLYQVIMN